jgi:hypothetical protein
MPELLRVYHGVWLLHGEALRDRWVDTVPFFSNFIVESSVEVDVPQGVRDRLPLTGLEVAPRCEDVAPRLRAHLDLVDLDPNRPACKIDDRNRDGPTALAELLRDALELGVGVPKDRVFVTCVRVRFSHLPASKELLEPSLIYLKEQERARERAGEKVLPIVRDFNIGSVKQNVPGYTVEFEVTPDAALTTEGKHEFLKEVQHKLRRLHSVAVYERSASMIKLFDRFVLDMGPQIDTAVERKASTSDSMPSNSFRHQEQHFYPSNKKSIGAIVFESCLEDESTDTFTQGHKVFVAHLDIIDRPDREANMRREDDKSIRKLFAKAFQKHVATAGSDHFSTAVIDAPRFLDPGPSAPFNEREDFKLRCCQYGGTIGVSLKSKKSSNTHEFYMVVMGVREKNSARSMPLYRLLEEHQSRLEGSRVGGWREELHY